MASARDTIGADAMGGREKSLARIIATGLVSATASASAHEAVSRLLAIQGQQPSAIPWAIGVRAPSLSVAEISEAFRAGELVRSWPMRGTVHVTTREDHHLMRRALRHRYASFDRACEKNGLDEVTVGRLGEASVQILRDKGALSREELATYWDSLGLIPRGLVKADASYRRHVTMRLFLDGFIVGGPVQGREHLIVEATSLPAAPGVGSGEDGHEEALAHIAARYAWGHGPIHETDFARWSGLPITVARASLRLAVEGVSGQRWTLMRRGSEIMRADIDELMRTHADEAARLLVLPSFDEVHVGYKDRACLADEAAEKAICPAKNGMFRPIVISNGRVVGVRLPSGALEFLRGRTDAAQRKNARAMDAMWQEWLRGE